MRRHTLRQFLHGAASVFGASMGEEHLAPLVREIDADPAARDMDGPGVVVVLDFSGIESATASYLKATLLWLLGRSGNVASTAPGGASGPWNIYPMVAGLNAEISEELEELLHRHERPCLELLRDNETAIFAVRQRGPLDQMLRATLLLLADVGGATATELHQRFPQPRPITVTAWNNRLSELNVRRLVRRTKHGRQWWYQTLAQEVVNG